MNAAQKEQLQEYYAARRAELDQYGEELSGTPSDDTREVVNRESLKIVCFEIAKFAVLIGLLHRAEDLSAEMLEDCMINIFDLVKDVQWNAHRAQSKAGRILSKLIWTFMSEFAACALHLLRCTVGYGPDGDEKEVASSALKVLDVYETKVAAMSLTNTAEIVHVLEWHETRIREILDVYEKLKPAFPSTEQRIITAVMRVISGTIPVIKELSRAVKEWKDSDLSKSTITSMENLAAFTSLVSTDIDKMMDDFFLPPAWKVSKILKGLDQMNGNVITLEKILLLHSQYASEESAGKVASLKILIQKAKFVAESDRLLRQID